MARSLLGLAALTWSLTAAAAAGVLNGELGRWLDGVAPELGETLGRHPRFAGETVRLVVITPGDPSGASNRLAQAVERRLRERLLEFQGVRLAADAPARERDCLPPQQIGYLVRVEVAATGNRRGRVHIAVVDVAESLWVSGISHQWQGTLTAAEQNALATSVQSGAPGTASSPIPISDAAAVAAAMKADLTCTLPRNLDGALYVAAREPPALARVGLALQAELMYEPLAAVTPDRDQARWLLTVEAEETALDVRELNLTLADAEGGNRQRVASVFVSGSLGGAAPGAAFEPPPVATSPPRAEGAPSAPARPAAPGLLSELEMRPAPPRGICDDRKARINSCIEIGFELLAPAYLFIVSTRDHAMVEAPCGGSLKRQEAGSRRYRVRVPPGSYAVDAADTGPDAGFYVLAVKERRVAQELGEALSQAPGLCGGSPGADAAPWLGKLRRVLERHGELITWRALHVAHDTAGIIAL